MVGYINISVSVFVPLNLYMHACECHYCVCIGKCGFLVVFVANLLVFACDFKLQHLVYFHSGGYCIIIALVL